MTVVACSAMALAIAAIVIPQLPPGPYPWLFILCFVGIIIIGGLIYKKMEMNKLWYKQFIKKKKAIVIMLNSNSYEITKEIQSIQYRTKAARIASEMLKLQYDYDLFVRSKEGIVQGISDEMGLAKIQFELESATKDCKLKLDSTKRIIELKESILENVNKCGKEVDSFYNNILCNIPNSPDEDFMDFGNLEKQINPLKSETINKFEGEIFKLLPWLGFFIR